MKYISFFQAMTLNNPDLHRLEQAAVLGIGTARAMAEVFELLRNGKIVSDDVKRQMFFENYEMSEDYISGAKVPRGQGFMLKEFEHNGVSSQNSKIKALFVITESCENVWTQWVRRTKYSN